MNDFHESLSDKYYNTIDRPLTDPFSTLLFSRWRSNLRDAIIRMSFWVGTHGPTQDAYYTVHQEYLEPNDTEKPRIDLENLRGVNLR